MTTEPHVSSQASRTEHDRALAENPTYVDSYSAVTQLSRRQVLAAWAATAAPLGVLLWVVAPWLSHRLDSRDPFIEALLLCFAVGLVWQVSLALFLVRREQGALRWPQLRDGLWLRAPKNPRTGRRGGKTWWWAVPFVLLSAAVNFAGIDPAGPMPRDLPITLELDRLRLDHYFHGNWGAFALFVFVVLLAPIGEEIFFRGLLLPRMRAAFGRADVVTNGVLFGIYHVHQPWSIPASIIDGVVNQAYPTRRYQSIWIAVAAHTVPSFVIIGAVVPLVL